MGLTNKMKTTIINKEEIGRVLGEEESEVFEVGDQVKVYQGPKNPPLVGTILEKSRGGGASLIYYEEGKWKEWVPNTALTKIAEARNDRQTK